MYQVAPRSEKKKSLRHKWRINKSDKSQIARMFGSPANLSARIVFLGEVDNDLVRCGHFVCLVESSDKSQYNEKLDSLSSPFLSEGQRRCAAPDAQKGAPGGREPRGRRDITEGYKSKRGEKGEIKRTYCASTCAGKAKLGSKLYDAGARKFNIQPLPEIKQAINKIKERRHIPAFRSGKRSLVERTCAEG